MRNTPEQCPKCGEMTLHTPDSRVCRGRQIKRLTSDLRKMEKISDDAMAERDKLQERVTELEQDNETLKYRRD